VLTGTTAPLSITVLLPGVAPNPEPEITTELPTTPEVVESALMTGAGAAAEFTERCRRWRWPEWSWHYCSRPSRCTRSGPW